MLTPIKIPFEISERWMNPYSPKYLIGDIVFVETWDTIPTFCFMSKQGACYHDLPLAAFSCELYHEKEFWKVSESPTVFARQQNMQFALLFDKQRRFSERVHIHCGFVWPKNNIILYLCRSMDKPFQLKLWPVHKLLFKEFSPNLYAEETLPNWTKNRLVQK